jgi:hypothetical protein
VLKRQRRVKFDASGERLLSLGLTYSNKGWYADALQFRCFRNPVTVSFDSGPSDIHPVQLEAIERLAAARTRTIHNQAIQAVYDSIAAWHQRNAPDDRCPSMRWVRQNARVGEIYFPAPRQYARGPIRPRFGLFATRCREDEHPVHVYFTWTGTGWEAKWTQ